MMSTEANNCAGGGEMKPGSSICPMMSINTARQLVEELYGLKVLKIKKLNGYSDRNYKVEVCSEEKSNHNIQEIWPHGYVLKVMNSKDSITDRVEAEHDVQKKLLASGISCTQPVLDKHAQEYSLQKVYFKNEVKARNDVDNTSKEEPSGMHIVRLFTFVPGLIIADIPYTPELLTEAGQVLAKIDTVLQHYSHPSLTSYEAIWNLIETPQIRDYMFAVEDQSKTDLIHSVLEAFHKNLLPLVKEFKRGVIHGDYHEQNILVHKVRMREDGSEEYCIGGIIDFGNMNDSYYIFEVAKAITHFTLDSSAIDTWDVGGYILAGYVPHIPLNNSEWKVLKESICARLCTLIVMGLYSNRLDPCNMYVLKFAEKGWELLKKLWNKPKRDLYLGWQGVIKKLHPSIQLPDIEDII